MTNSTIIQINPEELANLISDRVKKELQQFASQPKVKELQQNDKPHLTRSETARFFDISLNCVNDWSKKGILKPIKVGQRTYFRKSDLLDLMFNQLSS